MFLNGLAVLSAILLSLLSAYYSIYGLGEIFSYNKESIYIMAAGLEFAKVITALWLHANWKQCQLALKFYLSISVIILMLITSMGIFGYLSRSHIEHSMKIENSNSGNISSLKNELSFLNNSKLSKLDKKENNSKEIQRLRNIIDLGSNVNLKKGNTKSFASSFRKEKDDIEMYRKENIIIDKEINDLNIKVLELTNNLEKYNLERKKLEAELGPIRYVANFLYPSATSDYLEKSVTWLILVLIFVFDPLAIALLIASTSTFMKKKLGRPPKKFARIRKFKFKNFNFPDSLNLSKFRFKTSG